jgi:hypothetical protein
MKDDKEHSPTGSKAQSPRSEDDHDSEHDAEDQEAANELPASSMLDIDPSPIEEPIGTIAASSSKTDWQAIYSPAHNAYYFYNCVTQETTWANPLVPPESDSNAPSVTKSESPPSPASVPSAGDSVSTRLSASTPFSAQPRSSSSNPSNGIDPELAFLDPSLLASTSSGGGSVPVFTAKFNARTGRFAGGDARDPNYISEYERAKRMSEAYFDVDGWKAQVEDRDAKKRAAEVGEQGGGAKKKRPTKADLVGIIVLDCKPPEFDIPLTPFLFVHRSGSKHRNRKRS